MKPNLRPAAPSRRAQARITVQIPARVYRPNKPQEAVEAEIKNISTGGAYIHCRIPMQVDQELMIEIHFGEGKVIPVRVVEELPDEVPSSPGQDKALSRVRWTEQKAALGFGVEFSSQGPEMQKYLASLVAYYEKLTKAGVTF